MINSSHTREVFRWMRGEILCRGMQTAEIHNNCPHPRKPPFLKSFFLLKKPLYQESFLYKTDACLH
jgi:hypothetical protein